MENQNEQELTKNNTRDALNEFAVSQGLTDASTYQNKPGVVGAILRVRNGEDAIAVNDELKNVADPAGDQASPEGQPADVQTTDNNEDDAPAADDTVERPKKGQKSKQSEVRTMNQGHPTQFNDEGAPVYEK